jgi:hypothetical protein
VLFRAAGGCVVDIGDRKEPNREGPRYGNATRAGTSHTVSLRVSTHSYTVHVVCSVHCILTSTATTMQAGRGACAIGLHRRARGTTYHGQHWASWEKAKVGR